MGLIKYSLKQLIEIIDRYVKLEQSLYIKYAHVDKIDADDFWESTIRFKKNMLIARDLFSYKLYILWLRANCDTLGIKYTCK